MAIIKTIKDKLGNIVYPQTKTKAVYSDSGERLDNTIIGFNENFNNLDTSLYTEPTLYNGNVDDAPSGYVALELGAVNSPFSFWCTLLTIDVSTGYKQQTAYPWASTDKKIAFRVKDNGVWTSWNYIVRNQGTGLNSHIEGYNNIATGEESHAEGINCVASGDYSHAEGVNTTANGIASHSGGNFTTANGNEQTAIGRYNVADSSSLFIVGNGTSDSSRSNAMVLDSNNNLILPSGGVYGYINGSLLTLLSGFTILETAHLHRIGRHIELNFVIGGSISANTWTQIGTIADSTAIPPFNIRGVCYYTNNTSDMRYTGSGSLAITNDGKVMVFYTVAVTNSIGHISWFETN